MQDDQVPSRTDSTTAGFGNDAQHRHRLERCRIPEMTSRLKSGIRWERIVPSPMVFFAQEIESRISNPSSGNGF
jgi:hypothetical protein